MFFQFLDAFLSLNQESVEFFLFLQQFIPLVELDIVTLLDFVFEFVDFFVQFDHLKLFVG